MPAFPARTSRSARRKAVRARRRRKLLGGTLVLALAVGGAAAAVRGHLVSTRLLSGYLQPAASTATSAGTIPVTAAAPCPGGGTPAAPATRAASPIPSPSPISSPSATGPGRPAAVPSPPASAASGSPAVHRPNRASLPLLISCPPAPGSTPAGIGPLRPGATPGYLPVLTPVAGSRLLTSVTQPPQRARPHRQPAADSGRDLPAAAGHIPAASSLPGSAQPSLPSPIAQVLAVINSARAQAGLPPYTLSSGLNRSAAAHTALRAGSCGLAHQCPGEPPLGERESQAAGWRTATGENIAEGGPVPATQAAINRLAIMLTRQLLAGQPPRGSDRRNLLSPEFRHIGIAVVRDGSNDIWLTQDFSN